MEWDPDSGDEYIFSDDDEDPTVDYAESSSIATVKTFTILNENEILKRQNDDVSHISTVLSISQSLSIALLHHFRWNISQLHDEWFSDEKSVRENVGILSDTKSSSSSSSSSDGGYCAICFDEFPRGEIHTVGCDHTYCVTCWRGYISNAINETGLGCLSLRCPDPKCNGIVGKEFIDRVVTDEEEKDKYLRYLVRSYVEGKRDKTKWCPGPGCEYAVEMIENESVNIGFDVVCRCGHPFCWNCAEDAHRPVDCETVVKWMAKNSSEAENTNWILAYSKPCPKCKRPIEKNNGCNHMTCSAPCRYEFCWLCLGDYKKHGMCNSYNPNKQGAQWKDEDEMKRVLAKKSLERYTHYYERWASNQKSRQKAMDDLHKMQTTHLKPLSDKVKVPEIQLNFIVEAWKQIIECRRVLKWTYAYGYYIPEKEVAKIQLFECLQGEAEAALERLHRCVERELAENFLDDDEMKQDFEKFRPKLVGLTKVTCAFFENLVRALENGLSEADSSIAKHQKKRRKGSSSVSREDPDFDVDDYGIGYWNCDRCTYLNEETATRCQMCFGEN